MEASNANTLVRGLPGMVSNGQVILGNLVVFRQIGIKIPLAIEFTVGAIWQLRAKLARTF